MHIVVNHLTRMREGFMCVAGVDLETRQHVRPVQVSQLGNHLLACNGGPFDMAAVIDLGAVQFAGVAPEVEDHRFGLYAVRREGFYAPTTFWTLLQQMSRRHLTDIFGPDLKAHNNTNCVVDRGTGIASLGCLVQTGTPELYISSHGGIRLRFTDGTFNVAASVTDIRLYQADHVTPDRAAVADVSSRLARGVSVVLSVGLTRPWKKPEDTVERHWLQVNNIHLEDNPVWRLG